MKIEELRNKINRIDSNIIELLSKRRDLSKEIILTKNISESPLRDQKREEEVLSRLIEIGQQHGLDAHFTTKVFYEIIDDSVRLQQRYLQKSDTVNGEKKEIIKIAIQGIEGSYSYLAAKKYFSHHDEKLIFLSKNTFEDVVLSVEQGEADYAILPIENTTSGSINEVYDLLLHTTLSIIGEEIYHVKHCLVGIEEVPIGQLTKIFAHQQAAIQCSKYISTLFNCKIEYFHDTAMSVQKIKEEGNLNYGAIASAESAKLFGVKILRKQIANQLDNFTRFLITARASQKVDSRLPCKSSLVMSTSHTAGSLVDALLVFQKYAINMTKLESRPIMGNPWEEMFYIDFEGNIESNIVQSLLDELGKHTKFFKVLGSYPSQEIERTAIEKNVPMPGISERKKSDDQKIIEDSEDTVVKSKTSYTLASREYKKEDTIISINSLEVGGDNFTVIAGPCSVESRDQIMSCAAEVKENNAHILRGGCFKPRTSPYSFQGLEFEGLNYLKEAGKMYDLPVITEVLSPDLVQSVAQDADIVQIGARNMQNFSLLKEVGKVHKPVFLKRGLMSSIDELLNAAEYILAQGNRQVILCERGIRTFETATRNTLDLSAIPVLKELTHLPIFVDPSHAIGQRNKVIPMAKAAKVVGAHGIMIEFHPDPDNAMSDGEQSLEFIQFKNLMVELSKL